MMNTEEQRLGRLAGSQSLGLKTRPAYALGDFLALVSHFSLLHLRRSWELGPATFPVASPTLPLAPSLSFSLSNCTAANRDLASILKVSGRAHQRIPWPQALPVPTEEYLIIVP